MSTKEEQTVSVLLNLTRLSVWLHYYHNIYLIDKRAVKWKAPPHPPQKRGGGGGEGKVF